MPKDDLINSQNWSDIAGGVKAPIDFISTYAHGSSLPAKVIGIPKPKRVMTYDSGLPVHLESAAESFFRRASASRTFEIFVLTLMSGIFRGRTHKHNGTKKYLMQGQLLQLTTTSMPMRNSSYSIRQYLLSANLDQDSKKIIEVRRLSING